MAISGDFLIFGTAFGFCALLCVLLARWYVWPRVARMPRHEALILLPGLPPASRGPRFWPGGRPPGAPMRRVRPAVPARPGRQIGDRLAKLPYTCGAGPAPAGQALNAVEVEGSSL